MTPSKEVTDGKSFSKESEAKDWNNAHERCSTIIQNYKEGFGLFQMTGKIKSSKR